MGLFSALRRLFLPSATPAASMPPCLFAEAKRTINVVGEYYRQRELSWVKRALAAAPAEDLSRLAILRPEPQNQVDGNAVAVYLCGHLVGYLRREHAAEYQPVLIKIWESEQRFVCVRAQLGEAWDWKRRDHSLISVNLNLPTATRIARDHLDGKLQRIPS